MSELIVAARWIVTGVRDRYTPEIVEDGAVLARDGVIVKVGIREDVEREAPGAEVLDYGNHVMLPGFVNAHHHVGLTPLQLGSPDLPLELWFAGRIPARRIDLYLDTLYSAFEMIASGITTVSHIHGWMVGGYEALHGGATKVLDAYRAIGMACVGVNGESNLGFDLSSGGAKSYTYFTAPAGHTFIWRLFFEREEAREFLDKLTMGDEESMEWVESLPLESAQELKSYH